MNVAEIIAKRFHEEYERLAPAFGWKTQEASQVPWDELPKNQRDLMIHVVQSLMGEDIIADGIIATHRAQEATDDDVECLGPEGDCGQRGNEGHVEPCPLPGGDSQ